MIKNVYAMCLMLICGVQFATAQNFLNNQLDFKDGLYLSYDDFLQNKPTIAPSDVKIKVKTSRLFNKLKITQIKVLREGRWQKMDFSEVWGVCINGMPHIQYRMEAQKELQFGNPTESAYYNGNFVRIRIIGSICHFHIEDFAPTAPQVTFASMNDFEETAFFAKQKILDLKTGDVYDFNEDNLAFMMRDDQALLKHFEANTQKEHQIFMYLQKYNERNPAYCYGGQ